MVHFDQLKSALQIKYWLVIFIGVLFSMFVWKVMAFEFRFVLAISGGLIVFSLGMMAIYFIDDFLVYAFIFNIPFAIFAKTLLNHPEAMIDTRGIDLGLAEMLILGAYIVWFCQIFIARNEPLPKLHKIDYFIMLFILFQIISLLGAPNTLLGFFQIIYSIKFALIYFFIAHKVKRRHLKWIVILLLFAILLESLLSFYEVVTGNVGIGAGKGKASLVGQQMAVPGVHHLRAYGTTDSSHSLGVYYAMLLPIPLVLAMTNFLKPRYRLGAVIILCLGTAGLVLTFTRGGWLAFGIACVFPTAVIIFIWKQGRFLFVVLSILFVVSFSFPETFKSVYSRFADAPSELMSSRYNWNKTALSIWSDHILFGCGTGNYMEIVENGNTKLYETINWPVHNIYLYVGSEMGLMGFIAFFGIVFIALFRCVKLFKSQDLLVRAMALSIATALFAYLLYGLVNMMGRQVVPYYQFWAYIGLIIALERHMQGKTLNPA